MILNFKDFGDKCECGRTHETYTIAAIIESDALLKFGYYIKKYFPDVKHITAIYDENTYNAVADRKIDAEQEIILPCDNLHANEIAVGAVFDKLSISAELLVAVGSGTIHDITRFCAYEKEIPFVSCPTAASVDGFCSSVAAMTWKGFKKTFASAAPKLVIADLEIIKKSPIQLTRSGFGDIVGKYIALADWKIAHVLTGEYLCDRIYGIMRTATDLVVGNSCKLTEGDLAAYEGLMKGLILSGLAMQMIGNSRPASGAEHHISHFIEMSPRGLGISSSALHGEKVGVATILVAKEYKRLLIEYVNATDYVPISEEEICAIYGDELSPAIIEENEKNCALGISGKVIDERIGEIRKIIDEIPESNELLNKYKTINAKSELSDIGVDEKLKEEIFKFSPTVRNRLTFMRLRSSIIK